MGGACSTHWNDKSFVQKCLSQNPKEVLGIIKVIWEENIKKDKRRRGASWIDMAQNRDK